MQSEHPTYDHRPEPARKRGVAERVGAWSSRHRKTAILGWIVFGQLPDGIALAGIALIAGSGLGLVIASRVPYRGA